MNRTSRPSLRSLVAGAALLTLAACGSSASTSATTAPAAATSPSSAAATATTAAPTASSGAATTAAKAGGASACAGAADAARRFIGDAPEVTDIKVIGGCMVSVSTNLQPGAEGAAAAQALCDKASEAAYGAGAKSFSVDSAVKHELAAGLKGSPCIGEP